MDEVPGENFGDLPSAEDHNFRLIASTTRHRAYGRALRVAPRDAVNSYSP